MDIDCDYISGCGIVLGGMFIIMLCFCFKKINKKMELKLCYMFFNGI